MMDRFRDPASQTKSSFLDHPNDASSMAVPEHHIREQRLKQRKMNELKKRKQQQQKIKKGAMGGT